MEIQVRFAEDNLFDALPYEQTDVRRDLEDCGSEVVRGCWSNDDPWDPLATEKHNYRWRLS
jgi:hypothetical protein